jgi:hypothetical protein
MGSELGAGGRSGGRRGIHGTSLRGRQRAISGETPGVLVPGRAGGTSLAPEVVRQAINGIRLVVSAE